MPKKSNIKPIVTVAHCNNNFNCRHCNYKANNTKAVSLHMKFSHNIKSLGVNTESYFCDLCKINFLSKKEFATRLEVKKHMLASHN